MQYSIVGNDIALIMHYRALLKRSGVDTQTQNSWTSIRGMQYTYHLVNADFVSREFRINQKNFG